VFEGSVCDKERIFVSWCVFVCFFVDFFISLVWVRSSLWVFFNFWLSLIFAIFTCISLIFSVFFSIFLVSLRFFRVFRYLFSALFAFHKWIPMIDVFVGQRKCEYRLFLAKKIRLQGGIIFVSWKSVIG
jgi:hypothetical protein